MKLRKCVSDNLDYLHGAELGLLGQAEVGDGAGGGGLCAGFIHTAEP